MPNYNYRRMKVLVFVILLFALNGVYSMYNLNVPNLLHLVKNNGDNEQLCIAFDEDAYSAIEWSYLIPEDKDELPKTVSSYLPSQSLNYDCNFEEHQACNEVWELKNWKIATHTSKNYVPILDTRWEDFRTYFTPSKTEINENRFEIPKESNIGISVRSNSTVDILLCEGFNPATYPCYTITLGGNSGQEVYVKRSNRNLSLYKNELPILSVDEWKNFDLFLSKTGRIQLKDANKNTSYVNVVDSKPLNTLYLIISSTLPALWKIHKNQFLFTNISQYVPFGPLLAATESTLCLSMYVMMCENCSIYFYKDIDNSKEIVYEVHAMDEDKISYEWKHVKILIENVTDTIMQLFIKTNSNAADQFWAIDHVRKCVRNEIKINRLSRSEFMEKTKFENAAFSCHSLQFPGWRPKKQIASKPPLPLIMNSLNTTSIQLNWKMQSPQPYIIKYEGHDICSKNTTPHLESVQRLKSNGWIVVKPKVNEITISNLVPYTHYLLTFIDPIYEVNKTIPTNTDPTDKPSKDEIKKIIILPKIREVNISIPLRDCNATYGTITYGLEMQGKNQSGQILVNRNSYIWKNLEPYTNYTLTVRIARTAASLNDTAMRIINYYNFTTKPDVAPSLKSVKLYEIGKDLASFRYTLPDKVNGNPILVQVLACNNILRNCKKYISNITSCELWNDVYCVTINNLINDIYFTFKLSIKNNDTNTFGNESLIVRKTIDVEPGAPSNLSYNIVECYNQSDACVNISWSHPYNQRGVITYFEISITGNNSTILDIVKLENRKYSLTYRHQIRYLSYLTTYIASIRACNEEHKGEPASVLVKIDHIAQHINQTPEILKIGMDSVAFLIPKLDYRLNSSFVMVLVQQNNSDEANPTESFISKIEDGLCLRNRLSWIAGVWKISHTEATHIIIGDNEEMHINAIDNTVRNKHLLANTDYCINFIINNTYNNIEHIRIYHKEHIILTGDNDFMAVSTSNKLSTASIIVLILLVALILTIIVFGVVLYRRNLRRRRIRADNEHIYEPMPNDEYNEFNVVYNAVYDKLNHD